VLFSNGAEVGRGAGEAVLFIGLVRFRLSFGLGRTRLDLLLVQLCIICIFGTSALKVYTYFHFCRLFAICEVVKTWGVFERDFIIVAEEGLIIDSK
jgi:hypothetical protein